MMMGRDDKKLDGRKPLGLADCGDTRKRGDAEREWSRQ